MLRFMLLRGASAGALTLGLASAAFAQEALPTIEIGHAAPTRADAPSIVSLTRPAPENNDTYHPETATTALKTNTPIMDTPASVQVVPRAVLNDQKIVTVGDAVNNISGVIAPDVRQTGDPTFWIRGFLTYDYYLDGIRIHTIDTGSRQNLANVDRIEVLKGPASILFGRAEPGGVVNVVTKRPLETPYYAIGQELASYGETRTTLDATGPLTLDKNLLYRFNLAYENTHDFWRFSDGRNFSIAPKLLWKPDQQTEVELSLQYSRAATATAAWSPAFTTLDANPLGAIAFGARPLSFRPVTESLNQPWQRGKQDEIQIGLTFSHDLNENWNLKQRFFAQVVNQFNFNGGSFGWDPVTPFQLDNYAYLLPVFEQHNYYGNIDLTGKVDLAGASHTLLIGADYQRFDSSGFNFITFDGVPNINILAPTYLKILPTAFDPMSRSDFATHLDWWGIYVQDQVELPFGFHLLAGMRHDHAIDYDEIGKKVSSNAQRVTPRFGLLWRPIREVSLYGSYLTNFGAANGDTRRPLPPETAQQWEVGAKAELLSGKLTATLAYYDLAKQHLATPDPDPALAAQGYFKAIGEVRNRGVELDVAGEVTPGLKVIGGYSYIASMIVNDGYCVDPFNNPNGSCVYDGSGNLLSVTGAKGKRLGGVPRHAGSLWATYEFQDATFRGLKLGAGAIARSLASGDNFNDFQIPGYATVALMAGYETKILDKRTTFQINVNNLLDTRYYQQGYASNFSVTTGAPRSFRGSMKVEF
ncbi:TonB-dependent siderophore receptor [Methylosinus sp. LW4]|uniref:TonB-dependent siderophore receptor n=1 Tax=Methylosinus sp. LW4 TaxID=136993 RepID=UPI0003776009|nr:TonB-dependent siderophore receptor [Methylosinus sp. LW4]